MQNVIKSTCMTADLFDMFKKCLSASCPGTQTHTHSAATTFVCMCIRCARQTQLFFFPFFNKWQSWQAVNDQNMKLRFGPLPQTRAVREQRWRCQATGKTKSESSDISWFIKPRWLKSLMSAWLLWITSDQRLKNRYACRMESDTPAWEWRYFSRECSQTSPHSLLPGNWFKE